MIFVFYFFAAVLVWFSIKSFRGGIAYLNFFRSELARPKPDHAPFATVIAPCRGLDDGLAENLSALLTQDFPSYEVIFVVDHESDPAALVIQEILSRRDAKTQGRNTTGRECALARLVIAPRAIYSSQKVENLREAVLQADARAEAFVFVDSDARPSPQWLRYLVAPLEDSRIGAATGYRWFISRHPSFGSEMRSVWNASIASALGPNVRSNFCWGGSMAMRREVFDRLEMREKWSGTLSDDFVVTRAVKDAGLDIAFVPQALTASVEDCTFTEMLEFTTRQMKITRVYATPLWVVSFFGSALFNGVMLAAVSIAIFDRQDVADRIVAAATLLLVTTLSTAKAWLRLKAVRLVLTAYRDELRRQAWTQNTLWLLSPAVFLFNCVAALISRKLTWRGTTYVLKSAAETVIIAD